MDRFGAAHFGFRRRRDKHRGSNRRSNCFCSGRRLGWRGRRRCAFHWLRMRRDDLVGSRRGRDRRSAGWRRRPWLEPLHLEKPFHYRESNHQDDDADDEGHKRTATAATAHLHTSSSYFYRPDRLGFRRFLQIGIAVGRQRLRGFERFQVRRNIDVEELAVNQEEPFRVSEARELRKIFVLDFPELGGTDFRHPACFVEGEAACEARLL